MKKMLLKHRVFFGLLIILGLLLFKDPFSQRTLIPNFEPYPDALYYVVSARSLSQGQGLNIIRENRKFAISIPQLYSLSLSPAYFLNKDPRVFYFMNVVFALTSFFIFYQILKKLMDNPLIRSFLLVLYITNYFIYWLPTLAMAENLTLLLFLAACLLIISKNDSKNIILMAISSIGLYGTKYASIPLTFIFSSIYFLKILWFQKKRKFEISKILIYIFISFLTLSILVLIDYLTQGRVPSISTISSLIGHDVKLNTNNIAVASNSPWFSLSYIRSNIWHYLNAIIGGRERFLWDFTPIVPKFIGIGGILGLCIGLAYSHFRLISLVLATTLISTILFISTLYTYDIRYIYTAIPTLLLGFGIFLSILNREIKKQPFRLVIFLVIIISFLYYGLTNTVRIKNQISLNLRYAETPWYYISVLKLNEFFTPEKIINDKKPIVISAMPPFLVDFYSNGNYTLLPLSYQQEFRNEKIKVWGPNDYSDLPKLYEKYLTEGYDVYVARYGIGNEGYTNKDFQNIVSLFKTELVFSGCYEQCNIYRLTIR